MSINDITNALAARIDGFEIAIGGTVTPHHVAELGAISAALKTIGAPVAVPAEPYVAAPSAPPPAIDEPFVPFEYKKPGKSKADKG